MRIAFECKNERPPIGVQKIDEFVGKLKDVGIPLQNGVYVSASGYTEGAIERAQKEGIRVFTLEGLTKEGLSAILYEAFQAVVFLIADLAQLTIEYAEETGCSEHPYMFFNDKGEFCGYLHHFIWDAWRKGLLPFSIGEHPLDLQVPPNLYHMINEELKLIESINIKLQITGFVIGFPGRAEHFLLLDAANKSLERTKLSVNFDTPEGRYPVTAIRTEEEMKFFLERPEAIKVINRVRLPRMRTDRGVYWPPSDRMLSVMFEKVRAYQASETPELAFEDLGQFEGTDLSTAWEPISEKYFIFSRSWLGCTRIEREDSAGQ